MEVSESPIRILGCSAGVSFSFLVGGVSFALFSSSFLLCFLEVLLERYLPCSASRKHWVTRSLATKSPTCDGYTRERVSHHAYIHLMVTISPSLRKMWFGQRTTKVPKINIPHTTAQSMDLS